MERFATDSGYAASGWHEEIKREDDVSCGEREPVDGSRPLPQP